MKFSFTYYYLFQSAKLFSTFFLLSQYLEPAISVALHLSSIGILIVSAMCYALFLRLQDRSCVNDNESLVYRDKNVDFEFGTSLFSYNFKYIFEVLSNIFSACSYYVILFYCLSSLHVFLVCLFVFVLMQTNLILTLILMFWVLM